MPLFHSSKSVTSSPAEMRPILSIEAVTKIYAAQDTPAVKSVSLCLPQGDILGLLGPSGCGKTTLLRLIAGFETLNSGSIRLGDRIVSSSHIAVPPEERCVGMVFQDFALFPHLSVFENIAFGIKSIFGRQKDLLQRRVLEVLELVGLDGLQRRYPHELSGGQQQRIALARALAPQPKLVLLDEPLSNLDVQVRLHLRQELRTILKAAKTSAVFVTHDQEEALAISDLVAVMRSGQLEQMGTPEAVYCTPSSRFVAQFVTQANFLSAQFHQTFWQTEVGRFEVKPIEANGLDANGFEVNGKPSDAAHQIDASHESHEVLTHGWLMIRQEELRLRSDPFGKATICDRQFLGRDYRYCLRTPSGQMLHALSRDNTLVLGSTVTLAAQPETLRIFPAALNE
jgi:iron(III) transport system ATP-binding protein